MSKKKLWVLFVTLGHNQWGGNRLSGKKYRDLYEAFDDNTWDYILQECHKTGVNTILLDVGDGVQYDSHPELAVKNAWSKERVHQEITRCKELGITLIPKLNFSTSHDYWLGDYSRMISSSVYYQVTRELIHEIYEIFEHPAYIHLGMDEENINNTKGGDYHVYRTGELLWHDLKHLIDCVAETGATPWIWCDPLFEHPEEYKNHIPADAAVISPWNYKALLEEHFTPIADLPDYAEFFGRPEWADQNIVYCEDCPDARAFRKVALPLMAEGYRYIPTASVYEGFEYNTPDVVQYFRDGGHEENVIGYMTAPWGLTTPEFEPRYQESLERLQKAREKFYPEEE